MKHVPFRFRDLLSFELLFILFLFAGAYKNSQLLIDLNERFDLTLATALLSFACGVFVFARAPRWPSGKEWRYLLVYAGLLFVATGSYLLGPRGPDSTLKIQKLLVFNTWALCAPVFVMRSGERLRRFLRLVVVFGVFVGGDTILRLYSEGSVRVFGVLGGEGYQWLGRLAGMGVAITATWLVCARRVRTGLTAALLGAVLSLPMVIAAARQAIVGAVAAACYLAYRVSRARGAHRLASHFLVRLGSLLVLALALWWGMGSDVDVTWPVRRIRTLQHWERLRESNRWLIWRAGLELWQEHPLLGAGFGRFRDESGLSTWRQPHNLFLEALCELGAVGFLLVCGLAVPPLLLAFRSFRGRTDPVRAGLGALFVFLLTCAMFSGDITDNRLLFTFSGALLVHQALSRGSPPGGPVREADRTRGGRRTESSRCEPPT